MSSDAEYAAFLEKANQNPAANTTSNVADSGKMEFKTTESGVAIPRVLKEGVDGGKWYYTSDADEPFLPVALHFSRSRLPTEYEFAELIHHPSASKADITILDTVEWDPRGSYREQVLAVREACAHTGHSDIRVYKVGHGGSRVEYFLVGVKDGHLLGLRALSIEN